MSFNSWTSIHFSLFVGFRFLTLQISFHFVGFRFLTLHISLDFVFVSFRFVSFSFFSFLSLPSPCMITLTFNRCPENSIGDEFHYLFICSHSEIVNLRVRYILNYYLRNSNAEKIAGMLSLCHVELLTNLSLFLKGFHKCHLYTPKCWPCASFSLQYI